MIYKKDLLERIEGLEDVLTDPKEKYVGSELDMKIDKDDLNKEFKLLLDYLGLEKITEKSVDYMWEHKYDNEQNYLGMFKKDIIKYTDKIVKKVNPKK